ncbi:hypothetical protein [Brevibacillus laterosporus]|uniref:hypothetical protein n=1 Tax=Brevibacillus laterosporus TaxID=1465 RepID=UPI003D192E2B
MGRFVNFNETGYVTAIRKELNGVMDKVSKNIYKLMQIHLASLKIRKADEKYRSEIIHAVKMINKNTTNRLVTSFIGGSDSKPNQSFRAIYYEYGTGTKMNPNHPWTPSKDPSWNPNRRGVRSPIYYRKGIWYDLGGNEHQGKFKGGDKVRIDPRKSPIGQEITAQHWFKRSIYTGARNLDKLVLQAVKNVPITSYIDVRGIRERM